MYQALYRKWRPRSFDDVVGQEHITQTLKRQIMNDRLSHAYLFVGTRGTGKTTCAKILSRAANCQHPVDGNPCNSCPSCLGIESGSILDVEELDAASNNGVENIRAIRDEAVFTPASVKKRVYIIDEVHNLSSAAFNALLKILEEPPAHLIFILATTEIQKVPATILSRCQRFSFKRILPETIAGRIRYISDEEHIDIDEDACALLARLADGSMRDGLSLLDQCVCGDKIDLERVRSAIGLTGALETIQLLQTIHGGDAAGALQQFSALYMDGKDPASMVSGLITLCRDVLIEKVAASGGHSLFSGNYDAASLEELAKSIRTQTLLWYIKRLQAAAEEMAFTPDRRVCAELCLIELCNEKLSADVSALRARISSIESKIESGAFSVPLQDKPASPPPAASAPATPEPVAPVAPAEAEEDVPWLDEAAPPEKAAVPESAPALDPIPSPKAEPPGQSGASGDQWPAILAVLQDKIDIPAYSFISESAYAVPVFEGSALIIQTKNEIAKNMIDTPQVLSAVSASAEAVLGRPVTVRTEPFSGSSALKMDKLEALKKNFNNFVKFE